MELLHKSIWSDQVFFQVLYLCLQTKVLVSVLKIDSWLLI